MLANMGWAQRWIGAVVVFTGLAIGPNAWASDWLRPDWNSAPRFRLDGGLTLSRFEQQVKSEVGGATGERLVEATEFGLADSLSCRIWGPFSVGAFMVFNIGSRSAARFDHFDENNETVVKGQVGGRYYELWMGPLLRAEWHRVFFELGYGAYGNRHDEARDDLPDDHGNRGGALKTSPSVAWMIALGGGVPIDDRLELVFRLEYRLRYYDRRGGVPLANDMVHGTQSFTPFMGVAWRFGPH